MGYMGITVGLSDMAAGMAFDALEKMVKSLRKSFKEERRTTEFNTSGAVNVGLFCEAYMVPVLKKNEGAFNYIEQLPPLLNDAMSDLNEEIEECSAKHKDEWDDEGNRLMHNKRYKELRKAIKFVLENVEE